MDERDAPHPRSFLSCAVLSRDGLALPFPGGTSAAAPERLCLPSVPVWTEMTSADVFPSKLCRFPGTKDHDAVRFVLCREHVLGPSRPEGENFRVCGARSCRYHIVRVSL